MHEEDHIDKQPTLRVRTRPNDTNASGDIFGGWLMSHIDIACAIEAQLRAKGPVATVAVKELIFRKPLFVYDIVSFYTTLARVGNTSLTIDVEVYARRMHEDGEFVTLEVATATLVFVAIATPGTKRVIP
ncbi:MAG: acyl-CoA thioesterase [Pseudomonadota bacterium]|nr:acyl-CoA thioesterase [Pseudomonadota bacterium]